MHWKCAASAHAKPPSLHQITILACGTLIVKTSCVCEHEQITAYLMSESIDRLVVWQSWQSSQTLLLLALFLWFFALFTVRQWMSSLFGHATVKAGIGLRNYCSRHNSNSGEWQVHGTTTKTAFVYFVAVTNLSALLRNRHERIRQLKLASRVQHCYCWH